MIIESSKLLQMKITIQDVCLFFDPLRPGISALYPANPVLRWVSM